MRRMLSVGLAGLAVAAATVSGAGPEATRLSDHPIGAAGPPATAETPRGGVVVWSAHLGDPSRAAEQEVFGRVLGRRGRIAGPQRQLTRFGPEGARSYRAHTPAVSFSRDSRRYLLAWTGSTSTRDEIWVRLLDARGRPASRQRRLMRAGAHPSAAIGPQIAYNRHRREWLVVSTGIRADGSHSVLSRRVDRSGKPVGVQRDTISVQEGEGPPASVAYDTRRRGYLVAYGTRQGVDDGRIELRPVDAHGRPDGRAQVLFDDQAHRAHAPQLAYDARSGRHAVTWEAPRRDHAYGPVRAALVDGAGRRVRALDLNLSPEAEAWAPRIAASGRGGFLVTWTWSVRTAQRRELHQEIYARAFSGRGTARSRTQRISYLSQGRRGGQVCQASTSTARPLRDGYLVAFDGQDCGAAGPEVYAARVGAE